MCIYICVAHCRSCEIDDVIEQQLDENCGFIDNFARGTAHMFKWELSLSLFLNYLSLLTLYFLSLFLNYLSLSLSLSTLHFSLSFSNISHWPSIFSLSCLPLPQKGIKFNPYTPPFTAMLYVSMFVCCLHIAL